MLSVNSYNKHIELTHATENPEPVNTDTLSFRHNAKIQSVLAWISEIRSVSILPRESNNHLCRKEEDHLGHRRSGSIQTEEKEKWEADGRDGGKSICVSVPVSGRYIPRYECKGT